MDKMWVFIKTRISKIIQWGGFLDRTLGPLIKTGSPLIKNECKCH